MPFATNDGVRIYYEREGSGPPLLLHHGLFQALAAWRDDGYVAVLRREYGLILMDPRGHGASDKPHDPAAYAFATRVADVVAVLDAAGVDRVAFWGYSMGGAVGYAIARYAPRRFRTLIIGGAGPYARDIARLRRRAAALLDGGMAPFVAEAERAGGAMPPAMRARLLANDPAAIAACDLATAGAPEFAAALGRAALPLLLYAGDADPAYAQAARAAAETDGATFVPLPGLDHRAGHLRADLVLPHVRVFLAGPANRAHATG